MTQITILIPHGGLNGNINECLLSVANQFDVPNYCFKVHVLFDSNHSAMDIQPYTRAILAKRGIRLVTEFDTNTTSIIDLRKKLIDSAYTDLAIFLDSDAILRPDALSLILNYYSSSKEKVAFVEGMRIEVGGRAQEKDFSMELKQVSENVKAGSSLPCGDTCFLLFDVKLFKCANWTKLYHYFDKRGMGGSDFALTIDVLATNESYIGIPCYSAQCWHVASVNKGYWKNYVASDQLISTSFFSDYKGKRAKELKAKLFS